jgi:hypothetical protein
MREIVVSAAPESDVLAREIVESAGTPSSETPRPGASESDLLAMLDRAERHLDAYAKELDLFEISFGKWVAAGRLAAIAEDHAFFARSGKSRKYLAWLLRPRRAQYLSEEVVDRLREVQTTIHAGDATRESFAGLAASLESIIDHYSSAAEYPA